MPSKTVLLALGAAMLAPLAAPTAEAMVRTGDRNGGYEQRLRLKATVEQARQVGGYDDPFAVVFNLLSGQDVSDQIQPVITDHEKVEGKIWDNFHKK